VEAKKGDKSPHDHANIRALPRTCSCAFFDSPCKAGSESSTSTSIALIRSIALAAVDDDGVAALPALPPVAAEMSRVPSVWVSPSTDGGDAWALWVWGEAWGGLRCRGSGVARLHQLFPLPLPPEPPLLVLWLLPVPVPVVVAAVTELRVARAAAEAAAYAARALLVGLGTASAPPREGANGELRRGRWGADA